MSFFILRYNSKYSFLVLLVEVGPNNIQDEFIQAFLCNAKAELTLSMLNVLEQANKNTTVELDERWGLIGQKSQLLI